jgi:hypothetical protein
MSELCYFVLVFFYIYKVGFIIEKGKATARALQRSLEAGNSLFLVFVIVSVVLAGL